MPSQRENKVISIGTVLIVIGLLLPVGFSLLGNSSNNLCSSFLDYLYASALSEIKFYDGGDLSPHADTSFVYEGLGGYANTNANGQALWIGMENTNNEWTGKALHRVVINGLMSFANFSDESNSTVITGPMGLDIIHNGVEIPNTYGPDIDGSDIPYTGGGFFSNNYISNMNYTVQFTSPTDYIIQDGDIIAYTFDSDINANNQSGVAFFYHDTQPTGHHLITGYDSGNLTDTQISLSMQLYTLSNQSEVCSVSFATYIQIVGVFMSIIVIILLLLILKYVRSNR